MKKQSRESSSAVTLPNVTKFKDVKALLGVSRTKMDRLISHDDSGFPKPFWIGAERFFLTQHVRDWILAQSAGSNPQEHPKQDAA